MPPVSHVHSLAENASVTPTVLDTTLSRAPPELTVAVRETGEVELGGPSYNTASDPRERDWGNDAAPGPFDTDCAIRRSCDVAGKVPGARGYLTLGSPARPPTSLSLSQVHQPLTHPSRCPPAGPSVMREMFHVKQTPRTRREASGSRHPSTTFLDACSQRECPLVTTPLVASRRVDADRMLAGIGCEELFDVRHRGLVDAALLHGGSVKIDHFPPGALRAVGENLRTRMRTFIPLSEDGSGGGVIQDRLMPTASA